MAKRRDEMLQATVSHGQQSSTDQKMKVVSQKQKVSTVMRKGYLTLKSPNKLKGK